MGLVVGGVLLVGALSGGDEDSSSSSSDDKKYEAFDMCKQFVRDRLKAPSSATFRNYFEADGEVTVSGYGSGPYTVVSSVDSANSFGAKLRIPFTCTVTNTAGASWRLNDLRLIE